LEVVVSLQLVMVLVKYVVQDYLEEEQAGHHGDCFLSEV
jgi:hypothetical protein